MHLTRIQIPEFRALKNVDITFEKDFIPKIFPLGSENGGGKSTLLQLIFVLLHCANHPDKTSFIENMLARYRIPEGVNQQTLAKMDIWDGKKTVQIEFFCCNDDFLKSIGLSLSLVEAQYHYCVSSVNLTKEYLHITIYSEKEALFCRVSNFPLDKSKSFLSELSEKVFLIAPSTQIFLFMPEEEKKLMLQADQKRRALMN